MANSVSELFGEGLSLHRAGRLAEAERAYRGVLEQVPAHRQALQNLGVLMHQSGRGPEALQCLEGALREGAPDAGILNNLGEVHRAQGRLDEAEACYRQALHLAPADANALFNLALLLKARGRAGEAVDCYRAVLAIAPDSAKALNNLGNALRDLGRHGEAQSLLRQALANQPDYAEAHANLGVVLEDTGRYAEAEASFRAALALRPDFANAWVNLGAVLQKLGRLDEAVPCVRRALAVGGEAPVARSNLLMTLNYMDGVTPEALFQEHRAYGALFAALPPPAPYPNLRDPARCLRVGYVSGDLRDHPMERFIEPVLERHDRAQFEVYGYHHYPRSDAVTARLRGHCDAWRDVYAMEDAELADVIRQDGIDILVDLSGHTAYNRLPVFARKPAPVQVSWLGYLNTTGLAAMDYRFTDAWSSPPGMMEPYSTEALVRLPGAQVCYRPPPDCPEVTVRPVPSNGGVVLAVTANLAKISRAMLDLWARLLLGLPEARLVLAGPGIRVERERLLGVLVDRGVPASRVECRDVSGVRPNLDLLGEVDLLLDTHPYGGGTTTCQALWMGVPVVTLAGRLPASRLGAGLLHAVGLPELVAASPEEYAGIVAALVAEPGRLASLRASLRARMGESPLRREAEFVRHVEHAYRSLWARWCQRR